MKEALKKSFETLIKDGEYAEAEKLLVEFMQDNPDDWDAKLLYGTCRMMQGDSKTAQEIQQQAQAYFESGKNDITEEQKSFWKRYKELIIYGAIGAALIIAVAGAGAALAKYAELESFPLAKYAEYHQRKYAGPVYSQKKYARPDFIQTKYAGPQLPDMRHDNEIHW